MDLEAVTPDLQQREEDLADGSFPQDFSARFEAPPPDFKPNIAEDVAAKTNVNQPTISDEEGASSNVKLKQPDPPAVLCPWETAVEAAKAKHHRQNSGGTITSDIVDARLLPMVMNEVKTLLFKLFAFVDASCTLSTSGDQVWLQQAKLRLATTSRVNMPFCFSKNV